MMCMRGFLQLMFCVAVCCIDVLRYGQGTSSFCKYANFPDTVFPEQLFSLIAAYIMGWAMGWLRLVGSIKL